MQVLYTTELPLLIKKKLVFFDNDFLGSIFADRIFFTKVTDILHDAYFAIYPLTEFEFLRDVFEPEQRTLKEEFINKPAFIRLGGHKEVFDELQRNAMLLSKIYSHQKNHGSSIVDLLLASNLMYLKQVSVLVTGNKKDFPSCVFDTIGVMNYESTTKRGEEKIQSFYIVQFNQDKFEACHAKLENLERK